MDYAAFKRELLAHYVRLAECPAFKAHAWHQANELARQNPALWGDLPEMLTKAMKEKNDAP